MTFRTYDDWKADDGDPEAYHDEEVSSDVHAYCIANGISEEEWAEMVQLKHEEAARERARANLARAQTEAQAPKLLDDDLPF